MHAFEQSTGTFRIALRIESLIGFPSYFPKGNLPGGHLLRRVLELRLKADGILSGPVLIVGELNRAMGFLEVTDLTAAIAAIVAELKIAGVAPVATLAWYCESEMVWRVAHPETRKGETALGMVQLEELKAAEREAIEAQELAKREIAQNVEAAIRNLRSE